jgi:transcriptional regulator with XRE-family HTH domain
MNVVKEHRQAHRFTLEELADLSEVSESMLSFIERGLRRPGPKTKVALARALGVRVRDLFPADESDVERGCEA